MAVSGSGQNDGQVQVVSCASGDVLDVVSKEDLVGKDGRTAKKLIAGVLGDVPYTRIRLLSGDGHDVCNDEQMTEAMLTISESSSQVQVCKVGLLQSTASDVVWVRREGISWNADVLRGFLEASHDPNVMHECLRGETLLHCALRHGAPRAMRYLLQAWANPNAESSHGVTPLMAGMDVNFLQSFTLGELLEARGDINAASLGMQGRTALHVAAAEYCSMKVSWLLQQRADASIKTTDRFEETPLDVALARADPDVLGAFNYYAAIAASAEAEGVSGKRQRRLS